MLRSFSIRIVFSQWIFRRMESCQWPVAAYDEDRVGEGVSLVRGPLGRRRVRQLPRAGEFPPGAAGRRRHVRANAVCHDSSREHRMSMGESQIRRVRKVSTCEKIQRSGGGERTVDRAAGAVQSVPERLPRVVLRPRLVADPVTTVAMFRFAHFQRLFSAAMQVGAWGFTSWCRAWSRRTSLQPAGRTDGRGCSPPAESARHAPSHRRHLQRRPQRPDLGW